ncbi:MAG: hypothetical protein HZB92_05240 [Euryarchaeota archaeon]|nr:hypothetical protein [Euryarchaeota archaeon]
MTESVFVLEALSWLERLRIGRLLKKYRGCKILVLGSKGVGKSTYLDQLETDGIITDPHSPTIARNPKKFQAYLDQGPMTIKTEDVGGETSQWPHWIDVLSENKPVGIIFLIDHRFPSRHISALNFLRTSLSSRKRRCKFILFLVNKYDVWHKDTSFNDILENYHEELGKFRHLKIAVISDYCSAKTGERVKSTLSTVLSRFIWYY